VGLNAADAEDAGESAGYNSENTGGWLDNPGH
jgi:hypothetical protein